MRPVSVIVLGFALAVPGIAARAETSDALLMAGLGSATCADFAKAEGDTRAVYIAWAEGYMSGMNSAIKLYEGPPIPLTGKDTMSAEQQLAYVADFCTINPEAPFVGAAADLFSALSNVAGQ